MNDPSGWIHTIERFSLHDGPGIRTLIVMKGCPLKCRWCSSPHTQSQAPEILYIRGSCEGCGRCIAACPQGAVSRAAAPGRVQTDRAHCIGCGACIAACPNRARELSGRSCKTQALLAEIAKDATFYRRSNGGVTVGGGEPTLQAEFVGALLALCRARGFHTAMETCALTPWEKLAPLLDSLDLVYMDLKHMDHRRHREWTGASNNGILENIHKTAQRHQVVLRIPVIPGFNDTEENISDSAKFAKTLGRNVLRMELLPYHPLGVHRYRELERPYALGAVRPPADAHMTHLRDLAGAFGIEVEIGG